MIGIKKIASRHSVASAVRASDEPIVQNGLAITPSEMVEMMKRGEPISAQGYSMKDETISQRNDFFVPLEHTRGFDIVDGWNTRKDVQSKVRRLRKGIKDGSVEFTQASE